MYPLSQALLLCIVLKVAQRQDHANASKKYFCSVGVFHALYNMQLSYKHKKVSYEMCWNDAYLILGLEYQ